MNVRRKALQFAELIEQTTNIDAARAQCVDASALLDALGDQRGELPQALCVPGHEVVVETASQVPGEQTAERKYRRGHDRQQQQRERMNEAQSHG